jgi:hypothetical protein
MQRLADFQQLAPLIVTRDPTRVLGVLARRERGELTLDETIAELERIPRCDTESIPVRSYRCPRRPES